jgi:hypothetical protein
MEPEKPDINYEESLKRMDKDTKKVFKAIFMIYAARINKEVKTGVETAYDSLIELWEKGLIKFAFNEKDDNIYLLYWSGEDYVIKEDYNTNKEDEHANEQN